MKNKMFQIIAIFILFCGLSGCQLISFNKKKTKTPVDKKINQEVKSKIGLFISGAGANTFSAISLLELLQKEKIYFDFFAGTGWGAWLAAFYAKNQSVDEIKWNLFKLKEKGIFDRKWFDNKTKQVKLLKVLTKEILSSPLHTSFVCPALDKEGRILWMTERKPALAVFSCINKLPPLFFSFNQALGQGSLFSAELTMKYMQERGITTLIWIKPFFPLKFIKQDLSFSIFWKELSAYLDNVRKRYIHKDPQIIILETNYPPVFSIYDFSKLNAIMKSPSPLLEKEKIYRLKNQIKTHQQE